MGISRSSSLVIAFLMKEYRMDYHLALTYAKNKRKIVCPNEGFEKDLLRFDEYLKNNNPKLFENDK
jgi:protein-tyrosine phosphatase